MAIIIISFGDRALISTGRRGSFRSSQGSESRTDTFKLQWLTIQSSERATLAPRSAHVAEFNCAGFPLPGGARAPKLAPSLGASFWHGRAGKPCPARSPLSEG
jgi:hypothetical protein